MTISNMTTNEEYKKAFLEGRQDTLEQLVALFRTFPHLEKAQKIMEALINGESPDYTP